jgi:hypothetical protein
VRASLSASPNLCQTGGRAVAVAARLWPRGSAAASNQRNTTCRFRRSGSNTDSGGVARELCLTLGRATNGKRRGQLPPFCAVPCARSSTAKRSPRVVVADRARTVGSDRSGSRRCPLVVRSTPYGLVQAVRLARACGQTPAAAAPPLVSQSRGRQPRRPTITTLILLKSDVVTRESVWGRAQRRQHGGNKYRGISGF